MKNIEKILEGVQPADSNSVASAVMEMIGNGGVVVGATVAVVGDTTYPFDGIAGKVKGINNGCAEVEFADGTSVHLQANQLIPVK